MWWFARSDRLDLSAGAGSRVGYGLRRFSGFGRADLRSCDYGLMVLPFRRDDGWSRDEARRVRREVRRPRLPCLACVIRGRKAAAFSRWFCVADGLCVVWNSSKIILMKSGANFFQKVSRFLRTATKDLTVF